MTSETARLYYEDQTGWSAENDYALWRYFDRLAEYVGPTPAQAQRPGQRSARIHAPKTGVRDEELAEIQVPSMSPESAALLKAVLNSHQRYELALSKFPNLEALQRIELASSRLRYSSST